MFILNLFWFFHKNRHFGKSCVSHNFCNLKFSIFGTHIFSQKSADETVILKRTVLWLAADDGRRLSVGAGQFALVALSSHRSVANGLGLSVVVQAHRAFPIVDEFVAFRVYTVAGDVFVQIGELSQVCFEVWAFRRLKMAGLVAAAQCSRFKSVSFLREL